MPAASHKYDHVAGLLQAFPRKHVNALLGHFANSIAALENGDWEKCINRAGKFVEAVLKALAGHAQVPLPNSAREFKVNKVAIQLGQLGQGQFDDSIRLLIPRNCVFIYDIASNRGARHDTDIDANKMDAIAVAQNIAWVVAEMVRLVHKGALNPDDAASVVEGLMEKRYPDIEEIGGRIYVNRSGLGAREIALLVLERQYPSRMAREELINTLCRHGMKRNNAQVTLVRIKGFVDDDGQGNLVLRSNGRQLAEGVRAQR